MSSSQHSAARRSACSLGVLHLEKFWARASRRDGAETRDWPKERLLLEGLGLALEETLQYLGQQQPTLPEFEQWILDRNDGHIEPLRVARINAALKGEPYSDAVRASIDAIDRSDAVFSLQDLQFWEENGYVILREAISSEDCRATEAAIWEFLGMDPDDPVTWHQSSDHGIMRQFYHHRALRSNRASARIHKAFAQIWGTADLWSTVDRVSFNPPEQGDWQFPGPHLHWDTTLVQPIPFGISGLIYLTDTDSDQGAFTCVPGFHRRITDWLNSLPPDADPRRQNLHLLGAVPIAGQAGDLIIWHKALPHGSRPNHTRRPRIVQYLSMHPARVDHNLIWR